MMLVTKNSFKSNNNFLRKFIHKQQRIAIIRNNF